MRNEKKYPEVSSMPLRTVFAMTGATTGYLSYELTKYIANDLHMPGGTPSEMFSSVLKWGLGKGTPIHEYTDIIAQSGIFGLSVLLLGSIGFYFAKNLPGGQNLYWRLPISGFSSDRYQMIEEDTLDDTHDQRVRMSKEDIKSIKGSPYFHFPPKGTFSALTILSTAAIFSVNAVNAEYLNKDIITVMRNLLFSGLAGISAAYGPQAMFKGIIAPIANLPRPYGILGSHKPDVS